MEPQYKVITGCKTLLCVSRLNLQPGKFISPFLIIFLIQILLQDINLLIQRRASAAIDLILQDIPVVIMRGRLDILRIVLNRLVKLAQPDAALHQPVQDRPSHRAAPVSAKQQHLAVFITLQELIDLTDHNQRLHISDPLPVDGVGDLRSPLKILGCDQAIDFLQFFLIFSLVHSVTP